MSTWFDICTLIFSYFDILGLINKFSAEFLGNKKIQENTTLAYVFHTIFRFISRYTTITNTNVQSSTAAVETSNGNTCDIVARYNEDLATAVSTE